MRTILVAVIAFALGFLVTCVAFGSCRRDCPPQTFPAPTKSAVESK